MVGALPIPMDRKCDGSPVDLYEMDPTVAMAMSAVTRECGAEMARAAKRRIWQMMSRAAKRRVLDEDICIPSGRQAMMGKKCCRYTVKRRYFDEYVFRCEVLHRDLMFLGSEHAEKANLQPEFLASMHLINALDLQNIILGTSFQKLMARVK